MATDLTTAKHVHQHSGFASILREDEVFSTGESDDVGEKLNGWFDRLIVQAGVEISPTALLMLCLLCGITLAGFVFVWQENLLSTALAVLLGTCLPIATVIVARSRRQVKMLKQMPEMVGELARAARTGRSLEQCFEIVAEDTHAPLGKELQRCSRRMQMGVGISAALDGLPQRTGLVSLNVLATALKVHHQTGGDLVSVLERLSHTIRDRLMFLGRLRAATTASRATAVLMIALPPAILGFFVFRDPEYLTDLMASSWGRTSIIAAIILQILGSIWIVRILKSSQRT